MCMGDPNALTLTGLLQDPLTRMVMRSDGVKEQDFSNLMLRVQDCLLARQDALAPGPRRLPAAPDTSVCGRVIGVPANYGAAPNFLEHSI